MNPADIETRATNTTREVPNTHARLYAEEGWEALDHPGKDRLLLLYTVGRKSGKHRRTPLVFFPGDETSVILVGANGGRRHHPDWYLNLETIPQVWIRYKDDFYEAKAEILRGGERSDAWARAVEVAARLADMQESVEREIPVIRVRRVRA